MRSSTLPTTDSAFPVAELYNIDNAQVEACAMGLAENQDFLIGVKVRMSENVIFKHGIEPLKRGIQACEMCGWPAKMMVHIGGVETGELMSDILNILRPGDVLTHAYSGAPNMAGAFTNPKPSCSGSLKLSSAAATPGAMSYSLIQPRR